MYRFMTIATLMFGMFGCSKTSKLNIADLKWNPYKGGEVLVFHSNQGDTDTIFVQNVRRAKTDDDPLAMFPNQSEVLNVIVKHTDPIPPNRNQGYSEDSFFELWAASDKNTRIRFKLSAKNSWFYGDYYHKNDLENLTTTTLTTKSITYNDVIVLEPQSKEYYDRDAFVTAVYWSKSKGYVRYDLKNGVYWELQ